MQATIVKVKPPAFMRYAKHNNKSLKDLREHIAFLERYGLKLKILEKTEWAPRADRFFLLCRKEDFKLIAALNNSIEYIQYVIDTCRAQGGDPRTLEECIAFHGTTGRVAGIFQRFNREVPA